MKNTRISKINKLIVGSETYLGVAVPDGMYQSIKSLKTEPYSLDTMPDFYEEYQLILEMCNAGRKIPPISLTKSTQILNSLKKDVNDIYSVTALHYLNAGDVGLIHFHYILNAIIDNVNLAGLPELNSIYACFLYKGHSKDRENSRSYRTISTCPIISKALDYYIRELSIDGWNRAQADTQFQGVGMSHELASLLLTETIQYSLNVSKKPVYAIFLDAKSAFDRVMREVLARNLYFAGTDDHRLLYLDQRLMNRKTFCEFDKIIMGPIQDTRGLEQGGIFSSDLYKLYNNEQAQTAQVSGLGVSLDKRSINVVSCISLADDAVLLSNEFVDLKNLLHLTVMYCSKYGVELVPDKTKLVAFAKKNDETATYVGNTSSVTLDGNEIFFSEEAEHLGILRASSGNNISIMNRISAYRKQIFSLLPTGLAYHHRSSPASSLKIEKLYCLPVLLSGVATLVLNKTEVNIIDSYRKNILARLMRLPDSCPTPAVYFLAGSLPASAFIHLRQLSLFAMVCNLQENILKSHAINILLSCNENCKSWFFQIRKICIMYDLPHPLKMLHEPPNKNQFKELCRSKVCDYWHSWYCSSVSSLSSLSSLHAPFLSLTTPHPVWTTLDGNPFQARAASIQALFLSGRYRTERLRRHWTPNNRDGFCLHPSCFAQKYLEDECHILLQCPAYSDNRGRLFQLSKSLAVRIPLINPILDSYLFTERDDLKLQFLLDCSILPLVIHAQQCFGRWILDCLFKLTRTWCLNIHTRRMKLLGRQP